MLNNIKRFFLISLNQITNFSTISRNDNYTRKILNSDQNFIPDGYKFLKNFLDKKKLEILKNINNKNNLFIDEAFELYKYVEDNFYNSLKKYLGDDVILSGLELQKTKIDDKKMVSSYFHDDNLGHIIKIYFCLEGDGNISTSYIPKSNYKKYLPSFIQNLRFFFASNRNLKNQININYFPGDCAIFDTNGLHRGTYENFSGVERICLVLNFARLNKIESLGFKNVPKFLFIKNTKPPFRTGKFENEKKIDFEKIKKFSSLKLFREDFFIKKEDNYFYRF